MRKTHTLHLGLILLVLLSGFLLSACKQEKEEIVIREETDEGLDRWEQSLRAEMEWLWERKNYLLSHSRPDAEICAANDFGHKSVTISEERREADDLAGKIADQLTYAADLIAQSRQQWERFCQTEATAVDTQGFLDVRLVPASAALNIARDALDRREASRSRQ